MMKAPLWFVLSSVGVVSVGVIGFGLFKGYYFSVGIFTFWLMAEALFKGFSRQTVRAHTPLAPVSVEFEKASQYLHLFERFNQEDEAFLHDEIRELRFTGGLSVGDQKWLERFYALLDLKTIYFGHQEASRKQVWQRALIGRVSEHGPPPSLSLQSVTEAATHVGSLYWKLYDTSSSPFPTLSQMAHRLYQDLFEEKLVHLTARARIEEVTDTIQRHGGVSFFLLNLVKHHHWKWARAMSQALVRESDMSPMSEENRTALFWVSELIWFQHEGPKFLESHEAAVRYVYHLCFLQPERAGLLEIDSRFYSELDAISELCEEAFEFKEILIESIFSLWEEHPHDFDDIFNHLMESFFGSQSKIYNEPLVWKALWERKKEDLSREYLLVVEGNRAYFNGQYDMAALLFEKATEHSPLLKVAHLNLLFARAKMGDEPKLEAAADRLLATFDETPLSLVSIGNAFLLLGRQEVAKKYHSLIARESEAGKKVDLWVASFLFEQRQFEKAETYARRAVGRQPQEIEPLFLLSQCLKEQGKHDEALTLMKKTTEVPDWMHFYRFQLERDSGNHEMASQTLLGLPKDYFQDADDLESALSYARERKDFILLKHLRG